MDRFNSEESLTRPGYCEYLTDGFVGKKLWMLRIFSVLFCLVTTAAVISFLMLMPQIAFIWALVIMIFLFLVFKYSAREFEYCVSTGEMSVDVIYGKKYRRGCISFRFSDVDSIFPVDSIKDVRIQNLNAGKTIYACPKKSDFLYCIYIKKTDENRTDMAVVVDSCNKLVNCFKFYKRAALTERK